MKNYWNRKRSFLSELLNESKWSPHGLWLMIKNKNDLKKTFLNDLLFHKINIGSPMVCDGYTSSVFTIPSLDRGIGIT